MTAEERAIRWCELVHTLADPQANRLHESGSCCSECLHVAAFIHEAEEAVKQRCAAVALAREPSTYKRVWVIGDDPDAIRESIAAAILALGEEKP